MGAFHHRSIRMFDVSLETMTRRVASIFNISSLSEILGDTNEVVGRVVASLYNLHFDDATDAAFPLTEEDLVFLERFTFQGKPLFKKGIARYRVAGKLVSQGLDPREIEYATQYVFEGVEYNWPEAAINIQGVIPMKLSDQD
ncbi:MAG: hypothetical protein Q8P17_01435 [bacterium]|nr:hypothetical protein [bacterium]